MYVVHGVDDYFSNCFELLEVAHGWHSVALYQNVAVGQKFKSFKGFSIRSYQSLSSFDKLVFVSDHASDFNYFYKHSVILHDFYCLREGHASS